jgi:hypothetical protein
MCVEAALPTPSGTAGAPFRAWTILGRYIGPVGAHGGAYDRDAWYLANPARTGSGIAAVEPPPDSMKT